MGNGRCRFGPTQVSGGHAAILSAILHAPDFILYHVFGSEQLPKCEMTRSPDTPGGQAHVVKSRTGSPLQTESFPWTDTVFDNLNTLTDAIDGRAVYPFTAEEMPNNFEVLDAIATSTASRETGRP